MVSFLTNKVESFKSNYSAIELLMAITIIAILVILAAIQLSKGLARHRDKERKTDIATLQEAIASFYALKGYYPTSLAEIGNLPPAACQAPRDSGTCSNPNYFYKAFRPGTKVAVTSKADCDNKKAADSCVGYILYSTDMEMANNPYIVRSY